MSYLIENQVIEGFSLQLESPLVYGAYTDELIALEVGKTYSVSWDGVLYICTAIDVSAYGNPGDVALGDVNYLFGGESTGEPFAIGYGQGYMDGVATGVFGNTWYSKTAESSHTVSVALYVEPEEEQEGIVLKDRNGDDVAYYGIETVTFDTTTEGKQQTYSKGVVAEGVEVTLALADGDQVIQAPDGYLVKEATIKKPETLLPENIANGVEIAGVTGTYEGNLLEDLPIELDFSQGDQTVTAPDGYSVKSAIIAKPETLVPENIAEGVEVAGLIGTFAGASEDEQTVFTIYSAKSQYRTISGNCSLTNSVTIPSTAKNLTVLYGANFISGNSSSSINYKYPLVSGLVAIDDYSQVLTSDDINLSKTYSYSPSSTYSQGLNILCAIFSLDGAKYISDSEGVTLYLGADVTLLPSGARFRLIDRANLSLMGATSIPSYFFDEQTNLTEVIFPETLTSIGSYAFNECTSLKNVEIRGAEGYTIGSYAFYACDSLETVVIADGIKSIGEYAFCENSNGTLGSVLKTVTLGNSLKSIGNYAFYNCYNLETINLPETLTYIGNSAFANCDKVETFIIPESITSISESCFGYNDALHTVQLPTGLKAIGKNAFRSDKALVNIVLPEGVETIEESAFNDCRVLPSINLPESLTTIGNYAFSQCYAFESVTIPSKITALSDYLFRKCESLTSVSLPAGLTTIGNSAFRECSSLQSISIPSGVTSIGNNAFYNCSALTNVDLSAVAQVPTLGSSNFNSKPDGFTITVPASLYDDFIAATNWSALADYIVAAS